VVRDKSGINYTMTRNGTFGSTSRLRENVGDVLKHRLFVIHVLRGLVVDDLNEV
jgi:hypothetical protein